MKKFKHIFPIAQAIADLLHPYAEVVIHDLKKQKIAVIFSSFSKRKVGDDSLLEDDEDITFESEVMGPYQKLNWDGRKLKSITSIIKNEAGQNIGLLCINLDVSIFDLFQQNIQIFLKNVQKQPKSLFKNEWREQINEYVTSYLKTHHLNLSTITLSERKKLVGALYKDGAFNHHNAATYIAQVLNISRATIYNYLKEEDLA